MGRHISVIIPKDLAIFVHFVRPGSAQKVSLDRQKVPCSSELGSCAIPTAALRGEEGKRMDGTESQGWTAELEAI